MHEHRRWHEDITTPTTTPVAPRSIQNGTPLKASLILEAIECLDQNILSVHKDFEAKAFCEFTLTDLGPLLFMPRVQHSAKAFHRLLPG